MDRHSGLILATILSVSLLLRLWGIGPRYRTVREFVEEAGESARRISIVEVR